MSYATYGKFGPPKPKISGNIVEITSADHKENIIMNAAKAGRMVINDIWKGDCGPCIESRPNYEMLSLKYPTVVFCAEDVEMGVSPHVTAVPWFQIFIGGRIVQEIQGADLNKIEQFINNFQQGGMPANFQPSGPQERYQKPSQPPAGQQCEGGVCGYSRGNVPTSGGTVYSTMNTSSRPTQGRKPHGIRK